MSKLETEQNILTVDNVSFSYGKESILSDIHLDIVRGDYLGVVGPNGSGKTTLLKIILGLLKPSKGEITLFGESIDKFKHWHKIGYVPQKATNFDSNFPITVYEAVLMGRYPSIGLFRAKTAHDNQLVKSSLEHVDMWKYRDKVIGDLSGGQQQRVFIARALAGEPDIIFLDEPTTGVDQKAEEKFYALLKKLNNEMKLTLVLISHDIDMILREAKHIACLNRKLICYGTPEEFAKDNISADILSRGVKIIAHKHHN